jgi:hypothetical protein
MRAPFAAALALAALICAARAAADTDGALQPNDRANGNANERAQPLQVQALDAPERIADEYIVVFEPGASAADVSRASDNARGAGGAVLFNYGAALKGFAARLCGGQGSAILASTDYLLATTKIIVTVWRRPTTYFWRLRRPHARAPPASARFASALCRECSRRSRDLLKRLRFRTRCYTGGTSILSNLK